MEARGGIEPPIEVLQTCALPLGYRASEPGLRSSYRVSSIILSFHSVSMILCFYRQLSLRFIVSVKKIFACCSRSTWNLEMKKSVARDRVCLLRDSIRRFNGVGILDVPN